MSTEDYRQPDYREHPETRTDVTHPAPTPRTDGFIASHHDQWPRWDWQDHASAYADFARTLERELAAKDADLALVSDLQEQTSACNDQLRTRVTELERQLAEAQTCFMDTKSALIAALKDAERYDYLRSNWDDITGITWSGNREQTATQLDEYIDVARDRKEGVK